MPRSSRGFQGLLTAAPSPLPDDDELAPPAGEPGGEGPAAPAPDPASASEAAAAPVGKLGGRAAGGPEPARPAPAGPAGQGRAATTIRLRVPAAAALHGAWLHQRMHVNPRLSYPEFASEIVRLGLATFKRQENGS